MRSSKRILPCVAREVGEIYRLEGGCKTSIRCTESRCTNISLLSSLLVIWGIGCAIVARKTIASASDNHMPDGSRVTATSVPSKPYAGSRITRI